MLNHMFGFLYYHVMLVESVVKLIFGIILLEYFIIILMPQGMLI